MDFRRVSNKRLMLWGDRERAASHIGEGNSLLHLCQQQAGFQDLQHFQMVRNLEDGSRIIARTYAGLSDVIIDSPFVPKEEPDLPPVVAPGHGEFSVTINFSPEPAFEWQQENSSSPFRKVMIQDIFGEGEAKQLADVDEVYFTVSRSSNGIISVSFSEDSLRSLDGVVSSKKLNLGEDGIATVCQIGSGGFVGATKDGDYGMQHIVVATNNSYVSGFIAKGRDFLCFPAFQFFGSNARKPWMPRLSWETSHMVRTDVDRYKAGEISATSRPVSDRPWSDGPITVDACLSSKVLVRISHGSFSRPMLQGSTVDPEFRAPECLNPVVFQEDAFFPVVKATRESSSEIFRNVVFKCEAMGCVHPLDDTPFRTLLMFEPDSTYGSFLSGFRISWGKAGKLKMFSGCILDFNADNAVLTVLQPMPATPVGGGTMLLSGTYTQTINEHSFVSTKEVMTDSWPPETETLTSRAWVNSWTNNHINLDNKEEFESVLVPGGSTYMYGLEHHRQYFHSGFDNITRRRHPLYVGGAERLCLCRIIGNSMQIEEVDARPFESSFSKIFSKWTVDGALPSSDLAFSCIVDADPLIVDIRPEEEYPSIEIAHGKEFKVLCGEAEVFFVKFRKETRIASFVQEAPILEHLGGNRLDGQLSHESNWADLPAVHSVMPEFASLVGDIPRFRGRRTFRTEDSSAFEPSLFHGARWLTTISDAYLDPFAYTIIHGGRHIDICTPFVWSTDWGAFVGQDLVSSTGSTVAPHVYCFDHRQARGAPKLDIFCEALDKDHSLYRDPRVEAEEQKQWRMFATFDEDAAVDISQLFFQGLAQFLRQTRPHEDVENIQEKVRFFSPSSGGI